MWFLHASPDNLKLKETVCTLKVYYAGFLTPVFVYKKAPFSTHLPLEKETSALVVALHTGHLASYLTDVTLLRQLNLAMAHGDASYSYSATAANTSGNIHVLS